MARLPKDFLPQMFRSVREKSAEKAVAPHYLAEPFSSALKPGSESEAFFCHISWRQAHGSHTRAKRGKKATPRYVAGPFAPLCCVYSDFGGIRAILSGGNPPRYKTNHKIIDTPVVHESSDRVKAKVEIIRANIEATARDLQLEIRAGMFEN